MDVSDHHIAAIQHKLDAQIGETTSFKAQQDVLQQQLNAQIAETTSMMTQRDAVARTNAVLQH